MLGQHKIPSTRLHVILARKSPLAVVFRRGPSKSVALISWDTDRDEFYLGQWFKGRIYEYRCDLSPSGQKLVYFAASHKGPFETWTAVSRPPFLTALVLWPKGDAWGGGGLFEDERTILLNHKPHEREAAEGFKIPSTIGVKPLWEHAGHGEDEPILSMRMERAGWKRKQKGKYRENRVRSKLQYEAIEPEIWAKPSGRWTLERSLVGVYERGGPRDVIEYRIADEREETAYELGCADWADWSRTGDVLFARHGRLFRIRMRKNHGPQGCKELIDLRDLRFEPIVSPPEARKWGGVPVAGRLL